MLETGPGVLTRGGSVGSGIVVEGDAAAAGVFGTGVAATDSEPQASTRENTTTNRIAMTDRLVCGSFELIRIIRPSGHASEELLIEKSAAGSTALFLISHS
jgi:hypothetical protein